MKLRLVAPRPTYHVPVSRVSRPVEHDLDHLNGGSGRVHTDDGGQRRNWRLAARGRPRHERPVDRDLVQIIEPRDGRRLVQEQHVLLLWIPAY